MEQLHIPKLEQGQVRVFAVNRATSDMSGDIQTNGKHHVAAALLGHPITQTGVELFPTADLSGVGLAGYLGQGYDVPTDQLHAARSRLDALDGYVLLLFSSAFEGRQVSLTPSSDLTLIGTFGEEQPNMQTEPIASDAAQPYSGTPRQSPSTPPRGKAGSAVMIVGLIVLAGLVLWWALG